MMSLSSADTRMFKGRSRRLVCKGSAMVEGALILTALVFILLGAADFAQLLYLQQALVERARHAARWGAINAPTNSTAITNMVLYNQSSTPPTGTASYFNLKASNVTVTTTDSAGADYATNLAGFTGTTYNTYSLTVLISGYTYSAFSPYLYGTYNGPRITVSVPVCAGATGCYN